MPGRIVRDAQADDDLVEIAAHLILEEYLDACLDAGGLRAEPKGPLFRSLALGAGRPLSERPIP